MDLIQKKQLLKGISLFVFILFFLFDLNAQNENLEVEKTRINGTIWNATSSSIGVKFLRDIITREEEVFDVPLVTSSENGNNHKTFSLSFKMNSSSVVHLIYNGEEVPIYIDSGDDLFINSNGYDFKNSITFAGKGSGKSRFLKNLERVFVEKQDDYIFYELVEREAMDFRYYMDRTHRKMLNFFRSLTADQKVDFNPKFENYLLAEIDYWYAYNLLRYRIEHPISNGNYEQVELPVEYYSFLNKVKISNDKALSNRSYHYFIDQYIAFKNSLIASKNEVPFMDESLIVTAPSMLIFHEPNKPPILEEVEAGTTIKYMDDKTEKKSFIQIKEVMVEDFWYKVKTSNGQTGWVHGAGVDKEFYLNKKISQKFETDAESKYRNVFDLFSGKTLYYILANDFYWNENNFDDLELEQKLDVFVDINPYPEFDSILTYVFFDQKVVTKSALPFLRTVQDISFSSPNPDAIEIVIASDRISSSQNNNSTDVNFSKGEKRELPFEEDFPAGANTNSGISSNQEFVKIDTKFAERPTFLTSFSGKIESHRGSKMKLVLYSDPITLNEIIYELEVNSDNIFEVKLNLSEPAIGIFYYGNQKTEIYLEPNDLMQVRFNGNNFLESLQYAGKGAAHNNYLKEHKLKFAIENKNARKQAEKLNPSDYQKLMEKIRLEKSNFLNQSKYRNEFSEQFKTFAQVDIDFWFGYLMLNYPWEFGFANNLDGQVELPDEYYNFLSKLPISVENALPNLNYTYFLDQFMEYQEAHTDNFNLTSEELIKKYLSGESAAYFKAKDLAIACKRGKAQKEGNNIKSFIENNSYEIYNDVLRVVYNEAKGLVIGEDAPTFTLADMDGNMIALEDLKGKVVYLDFWATWCSPCIHQMKNSKIWKSQFSDEEVVFVYISLDKNREAWERFVNNNDVKGLHLIATGGDVYKSQVAKLYKVKNLPSYFLIDKNGKIAYKPEGGKNFSRVEEKIKMLTPDR